MLAAGACGDSGDDGEGGSGAGSSSGLISACEDYCSAALAQPCGENQLTVEQCQSQCGFLPTQLKGICETENAAAFECLAEAGFTCTGYDTDGDEVEDTFTPVANATCLEEQQAYATCETTAGCKRFCITAEDAGCGEGCLERCESKRAEVEAASATCGIYYSSYVSCGSSAGITCDGGTPRPNDFCIDSAFNVGDCVNPDATDDCPAYCFGAEEIGCMPGCDAECASRLADATCGQAWASLLDCVTFFGDATCENDVVMPTADGICSSEREAYLACGG